MNPKAILYHRQNDSLSQPLKSKYGNSYRLWWALELRRAPNSRRVSPFLTVNVGNDDTTPTTTLIMSGRPPGKPDLSGYNYGAISSLVLTADRSALPRRDKEPDGAPTTLSGRIDPREMGSRVQRAAPKDLDKKKKKAADKQDPSERTAKRKQEAAGFGYADILEATQDVEGLTYRPRTAETREVYELILSTVHLGLGDQAQDVVRSAADTVLETLKSENMKDFDKKKEVEDVLGPVTGETFSRLINLSKKITDYGAEDETMADPDMERKDAEIDDEVGVAVVFDEEEQESDEEEGFEIRDESEEEEEGEGDKDAAVAEGEEEGEDALVIGGASSSKAGGKAKADKDIVSPHSVDAFWVQRLVSDVYSDPQTASDKTIAVLSVLGSESNLRDCENQLMELFDYQSFDVITKFLKNRDVVVWCTKLARSDANERVDVEVAMREKGLGWILRELAGDRQAKAHAEDAMDVDEQAKSAQVPKTATLAPGSVVQPKKTVDLESMVFSQGGHLMSNKTTKLPQGSFKRAKKGYEEIHVPAPKSKPVATGEAVPITDLPEWARQGFPGLRTLNRVQSKLYPIAFGTDEPILLCAPTGAGKACFVTRSF
jgi:pre-mRNA-splicing helicase BRR2